MRRTVQQLRYESRVQSMAGAIGDKPAQNRLAD